VIVDSGKVFFRPSVTNFVWLAQHDTFNSVVTTDIFTRLTDLMFQLLPSPQLGGDTVFTPACLFVCLLLEE